MAAVIVHFDQENAKALAEFNVVRENGYNRFDGTHQRLFANELLRVAERHMDEEEISGIPHVRVISKDGKQKLSMTFAREVGTDDVTFARVEGAKVSQTLLGRSPVEIHSGALESTTYLEAPYLKDGDKILVEAVEHPLQDREIG